MNDLTALVLTQYSFEHRIVHSEIERVLEMAGIRVMRLDDVIQPGALWASAVTDAIKKADFIIADLTELNPNIIYEIGFAHALEKSVFMVINRDAETDIPSDLTGYRLLFYNRPSELGRLVKDSILPYIEKMRSIGESDGE